MSIKIQKFHGSEWKTLASYDATVNGVSNAYYNFQYWASENTSEYRIVYNGDIVTEKCKNVYLAHRKFGNSERVFAEEFPGVVTKDIWVRTNIEWTPILSEDDVEKFKGSNVFLTVENENGDKVVIEAYGWDGRTNFNEKTDTGFQAYIMIGLCKAVAVAIVPKVELPPAWTE